MSYKALLNDVLVSDGLHFIFNQPKSRVHSCTGPHILQYPQWNSGHLLSDCRLCFPMSSVSMWTMETIILEVFFSTEREQSSQQPRNALQSKSGCCTPSMKIYMKCLVLPLAVSDYYKLGMQWFTESWDIPIEIWLNGIVGHWLDLLWRYMVIN